MQKNRKALLLIILAGLVLRLFLAVFLKESTAYADLISFQAWSLKLAADGFNSFYGPIWSDYLPGYLYMLWLLGHTYNFLLAHAINIPFEIFYKLPSIFADLGNAAYIYLIAQKFTSQKKALIASAIFLINPAIFANSTLWGQADSFMALFLLSSFYYLLEGKFWISALLLGIGQTVKPIAILALPIYLLYILFKKNSRWLVTKFLLIFVAIIFLLFIPFNNTPNLVSFIIDRHLATSNQYPYTSVNAINFWSVVYNFWQSDQILFTTLTLQQWGYLLFLSSYGFLLAFTFFKLRKAGNQPLFLSFILALCYFGMYLFLTRMHERHLFFGLSFISLLLPIFSPKSIIIVSGGFVIYLINLYYAQAYLNKIPFILGRSDIISLSLLVLAIFLYMLFIFLRKYAKQN